VTGEQLGLEGMPRRLYACTPTRLTSWLDCPRRYRFSYLDRPTPAKGPPWAHNSLGSSVHNALRSWWDVPLERRTPQAAGTLVESGWLTDGYRDDAQSSSVRARARAMVERYVARLDPEHEPRAVERTVATKTERLALSGRVDRIDERLTDEGVELVVVDYKTGRRPLVESEARGSLALAMYVLGTRRTLRAQARRVELHHLPTEEVQGFDHTEESLGRHLQRAEAIADEASAADAAYRGGAAPDAELDVLFPPKPGALCGWCDFRRHCPEGLAASQPKQPWDAVEEMALE
jgi:RecB family exonuclease